MFFKIETNQRNINNLNSNKMKKVIIILLLIGWMPVAMSQATAGFFNYNGQEQVIYPGQVATLELKVFNSNGGPFQISFQRNGGIPETKVDIPTSTHVWGEIINETTTFSLLNVKNPFGERIAIDPSHASITVKVIGTGVEEDSSCFAIYPNPAIDAVHVIADDEISKVEVYNIIGQLQKSVSVTGTALEMDISDLSSGVYFLKFIGDKKPIYRKLIKE